MNPVRSKKSKISADSQNANRTSNGMKKKQLTVLVLSLALVGMFLPASSARAQFERPFGVIVSFSVSCTFAPGNIWVWFYPLYLGGPVVASAPMVYSPYATRLFANFNIAVPSKYHLGSYVVTGPTCWMYAVAGCFPLTAIGLMTKVGTN